MEWRPRLEEIMKPLVSHEKSGDRHDFGIVFREIYEKVPNPI